MRGAMEKGEGSAYAKYFDIDWKEKLMAPFLGSALDEVLEKNELSIVEENGKHFVQYFKIRFPLRPGSLERGDIRNILDAQHYRLCHWQETDHQINYRRFFTINSLICLNIHDKNVFEDYHRLVKELVAEGVFQGLRIDHIDGLYDPKQYLDRLEEATPGCYVTVEKILQPGEALPADWKADGNTGYDFLALVNNLLTYKRSEQKFTSFYQQLTGDTRPIEAHIIEKKSAILFNHMNGELENLYQVFRNSDLVEKSSLSVTRQEDIKLAIAEMLIHCPVYRYYGNTMPLNDADSQALENIFSQVQRHNNELSNAVDLLRQALLINPREGNTARNGKALHFYQRCMQFSGPLMAKGVEDTLMYSYNRFVAHNEVGDQPASFGIDIAAFHQAMIHRQIHSPYSQNASSTHDTKRGEDSRARLNVLTAIPEQWFQKVEEWQRMNQIASVDIDPNDEYMIYQSLLAAWPFPGTEEPDFKDRFFAYLQKALREAKTNSNWTSPNEEYEKKIRDFVEALLKEGSTFLGSFRTLLNKIFEHGILNSFTQLILKFTCPGIPDLYQGTESWDLSFVDPDNRRPVDYQKRQSWLHELETGYTGADFFRENGEDRYSGKSKLWLTNALLQLRKNYADIFLKGEYIPLNVKGEYKDHIIAFARNYQNNFIVVALPLYTALLVDDSGALIHDWKDTEILLPENASGEIQEVLSGAFLTSHSSIMLSDAFAEKPFLIAKGKLMEKERNAGLLLHITSLPSPYGIGDFGPEAREFANFLQRSGQRYWQLLPINPTEAGQGHSPYSAISGMAGNPLLISPALLVSEGLLNEEELDKYRLHNEGTVQFAEAAANKEEMLNKAFWTFVKDGNRHDFEEWRVRHAYWLDDFALYSILKKHHGGKAWYDWEDKYKLRDPGALAEITDQYHDDLYQVKWVQFIFDKQWSGLKNYCHERGISLIGDLPIYVSYDSSDAWANREIFAIDENGRAMAVAGVPPDAFSADGQLWGMPVFRWEVLKGNNYAWWINRVKRNRELFDLIRIDHFRAFAAYWEVPADSPTSSGGEWREGPGAGFFKAIESALGELPFIAEDLGEVDAAVFDLRDQFHLPGMKVLQFAFGPDMPSSVHIPHNHSSNFVVYTGTHDNNTIKGWFRNADEQTRRSLTEYLGHSVSEEEVHWALAKMAFGSVAKTAILPVQDLLNLDDSARMNVPASAENNWAWRLMPGQLDAATEDKLKHLCWLYNR